MKKRTSQTRRACRSRIPCAKAFPGGRGSKLCPEDVDARQMRVGISTELEHTKSRPRACAIALDHLSEDRRYYSKLRRAKL
jgi:hypothetical protein